MRAPPLVLTKLNPPRTTGRLVHRRRLYRALDRARELPVTLISAPAGFGKSTLVSGWLQHRDDDFAWFSLDEGDRDLGVFLRYLWTALDRLAPGRLCSTRDLLDVPSPVPVATIAATLVNELDAVDREWLVVLDDFHRVRSPEVDELLGLLLEHPPGRVSLVLLSRSDPPLPWSSLKAAGKAVVLRARELQFEHDEASRLLAAVGGSLLDREEIERLVDETEGWAAGIQLAALNLRRNADLETCLVGLRERRGDAVAFLAVEVLDRLAPVQRKALLTAAVPERFSIPLLDALGDEDQGAQHLEWLRRENLFVFTLDGTGEWFRFHHLFRELLLHELELRGGKEVLGRFRKRAASWFESEGYLDEAFELLSSGRLQTELTALVLRQRSSLMAGEAWDLLERWSRQLDPDTVNGNVELLLLRAWIADNRYRYGELRELCERAEGVLELRPTDQQTPTLRAELDLLRGALAFYAGDIETSERLVGTSLGILPIAHLSEHGFGLVIRIMVLQMLGRAEEAMAVAMEALAVHEIRGTTMHARILVGLSFALLRVGDTARLLRYAGELLAVGTKFGLAEARSYGRYFVAVAHWDRGDVDRVEEVLAEVAEQRVLINLNSHVYSVFLLALARAEGGRETEGRRLLRELAERAIELQNPELIGLSESFEAEFDRRHHRSEQALRWARETAVDFDAHQWHFYRPELTWIRAMKTSPGAEERALALEGLARLEAKCRERHDQRTGFDLALIRLTTEPGDRRPIQDYVDRAKLLELVRPFLDSRQEVLPHLRQSGVDSAWSGWALIGEVPREPAVGKEELHEQDRLTNREHQVLECLSRRLTNKEIAGELVISSATVKRHTANIYSKLGVHGRLDAVERARGYGLI